MAMMNNIRAGSSKRRPLVLAASSLLVLGSMVGAWVLIEQSKTTEVFLVTKQNLASGTSLTASDLDQIPLSMFEISASYLQPDALVDGLVLTRPLAAGEAVPISALTTAELTNWSNVVLTPALELSSQIEVGTKVSIWSSPHLDFQTFGEPDLLATDIEVVKIIEPQGNFADTSKSVELRVPKNSLQYLIGAITNNDALALTSHSRTS
jgi:hypothetical protein